MRSAERDAKVSAAVVSKICSFRARRRNAQRASKASAVMHTALADNFFPKKHFQTCHEEGEISK